MGAGLEGVIGMRGGDGTLYLLGLCEGNHCEQVRYHTSAEPATPHVTASHTMCFSRQPTAPSQSTLMPRL